MIIGIKPLGHFHSRYIQAIFLIPSSHCKIQIYFCIFFIFDDRKKSFGNGIHHEAHIQHMVVERKIIAWN